jgi:hypothetical protein
MRKHVADPTPNPQQSDARTRCPREELTTRTCNASIATRSTFRNPTFASAASCQLRRDLGFVALLASDGRAYVNGGGGQKYGPRLAVGDARAHRRRLSSGAR